MGPRSCLAAHRGDECSQTALWDVSVCTDSRRFGLSSLMTLSPYLPIVRGRLRATSVGDSKNDTTLVLSVIKHKPLRHRPLSGDSGRRFTQTALCGCLTAQTDLPEDWGNDGAAQTIL